jgi:hypothetical protein
VTRESASDDADADAMCGPADHRGLAPMGHDDVSLSQLDGAII